MLARRIIVSALVTNTKEPLLILLLFYQEEHSGLHDFPGNLLQDTFLQKYLWKSSRRFRMIYFCLFSLRVSPKTTHHFTDQCTIIIMRQTQTYALCTLLHIFIEWWICCLFWTWTHLTRPGWTISWFPMRRHCTWISFWKLSWEIWRKSTGGLEQHKW